MKVLPDSSRICPVCYDLRWYGTYYIIIGIMYECMTHLSEPANYNLVYFASEKTKAKGK